MSVPIKELFREIVDLVRKNVYLVVVYVMFSMISFVVGSRYSKQLMGASIDQPPVFDTNMFMTMMGITFIGVLLSIYFILQLMDDDDNDLISIKKIVLTLKQIPNMFVTGLATMIRIIPFIFLMSIILFAVFIPFGMLFQESSTSTVFMIVVYTVVFTFMILVMARFALIYGVSMTTKYKYWSSTTKGIEMFKANKKNVYFISFIMLPGFLIPSLIQLYVKITNPEDILLYSSISQFFIVLISVLGLINMFATVAIIKRNMPKEDFVLE
ncbi:hypothetical protein [Spirochaeta cellobiosiphila]|uniref:hypothetical protein n=1 Tax=Spirochaeta cellobiosiphila TaxID=504483 RepID=UPI00042764C9|nr:hypothetical protein [Spirochaeta cellobiosiphila]